MGILQKAWGVGKEGGGGDGQLPTSETPFIAQTECGSLGLMVLLFSCSVCSPVCVPEL